ncbi:MAG: hypothetical protein O4861_15155 [Trichodesmium sp. St16_bin4-tuft]|nr:hypothetical protein [Trichodesmium sp. St16_bin4-tuft]
MFRRLAPIGYAPISFQKASEIVKKQILNILTKELLAQQFTP